MKVHEIMTAHARCVSPDNTLVEAAGLMRELDVGVLPVCEDDKIAGMITDRDMAVRAIASGRDPNETAVRDVMTPGVISVMAEQQVEEAVRIMQENEIRRLPVLNREKRLVGILSLGDIAVSSNPAFSGLTLREVSQPHNPNGRERKREALGRAAAGAMHLGEGREGRAAEEPASQPASARKRSSVAKGETKGTRARGERKQRQPKRTKASERSARSGSASSRGRKRPARARS